MKTKYFLLGSLLTLGLALVFMFTGFALAQEPDPGVPSRALVPDGPVAPDASSAYIPIQGRLTNAAGGGPAGVTASCSTP